MQEKSMWYGQFLRAKRLSDTTRELSLMDVARELGVSASFVSDVEQGRRDSYDEDKTERLIKFLKLTGEDIALMNDLATKGNIRPLPNPKNVVAVSDVSDLIRVAFI